MGVNKDYKDMLKTLGLEPLGLEPSKEALKGLKVKRFRESESTDVLTFENLYVSVDKEEIREEIHLELKSEIESIEERVGDLEQRVEMIEKELEEIGDKRVKKSKLLELKSKVKDITSKLSTVKLITQETRKG